MDNRRTREERLHQHVSARLFVRAAQNLQSTTCILARTPQPTQRLLREQHRGKSHSGQLAKLGLESRSAVTIREIFQLSFWTPSGQNSSVRKTRKADKARAFVAVDNHNQIWPWDRLKALAPLTYAIHLPLILCSTSVCFCHLHTLKICMHAIYVRLEPWPGKLSFKVVAGRAEQNRNQFLENFSGSPAFPARLQSHEALPFAVASRAPAESAPMTQQQDPGQASHAMHQ